MPCVYADHWLRRPVDRSTTNFTNDLAVANETRRLQQSILPNVRFVGRNGVFDVFPLQVCMGYVFSLVGCVNGIEDCGPHSFLNCNTAIVTTTAIVRVI